MKVIPRRWSRWAVARHRPEQNRASPAFPNHDRHNSHCPGAFSLTRDFRGFARRAAVAQGSEQNRDPPDRTAVKNDATQTRL